VTLLEAQSIGWGASARNGGQALSCLHDPLAHLVEKHGRDRARAMFLAAVRAAETVEQVIKDESIECDYWRSGSVEAASRPAHFETFEREQAMLYDVAGYKVQLVPKGEVASELGTQAYHGLMINPRGGSVQPAKFVHGLASAAERAGAEIHEATRVLAIERLGLPARDGSRFLVRTDRGDVHAKDVVLAANAWVGTFIPEFRGRVFPVESFILATEPLPAELAARLIPNNRVVYDTRRVLAYYRLSPDNRMVWGGEVTFSGVRPEANIHSLRRGMLRIFPELSDFKIEYYWGGTLGLTLTESAHAGMIDGMWYSMCYVGHGVTLAVYLGRQVANGILGRSVDNPFADLPIPRIPLLRDRTWYANVVKAWYGFLDRIA
ncbi:MAG: FAD-binding oxidoreductase, partial [Gammaproteobacteria bacterium]|nr:FAD-binding oxidoreductase [Gammaproteobacteria bacterium]